MPTDPTNEAQWTPPFCAHDPIENVACPKCESESVCPREHDVYREGDEVDAFCSNCHAALRVYASVEIVFSDVEACDAD